MELESTDRPPTQFKVDYIKSNHFRVVHADGAFGGLTPRGYIQMEIWSERQPIPKQTTYQIVDAGDGPVVGEEVRDARIVRDSIIREVEVGIVLDIDLARLLITWLQDRVEALEKATAKVAGKEPEIQQS